MDADSAAVASRLPLEKIFECLTLRFWLLVSSKLPPVDEEALLRPDFVLVEAGGVFKAAIGRTEGAVASMSSSSAPR